MTKTFKAVLTKNVTFIDFLGNTQDIPAGRPVDIMQIRVVAVSVNRKGEPSTETEGDFIASFGNHSFDIARGEFKTID